MQIPFNVLAATILLMHLAACGRVDPPAESGTATEPPAATQPADSAAAAAGPGEAGCRLTMGWDPWPPFHYTGFGGELTGFDVELLRYLAEDAGCELAFERDSWASLLGRIRSGNIDLVSGATMTEARQEFALFSAPLRREEFALFIRVGETHSWDGDNLEALMRKGLRLGITDAYVYDEMVERVIENPDFEGQIVRSRFGEANIGRLLDGEIDAFVDDTFAARTMIRRLGFEGAISRHPLELGDGSEVRIMYSKANVSPQLVARLDDSLARLRESGEYEALARRYLD